MSPNGQASKRGQIRGRTCCCHVSPSLSVFGPGVFVSAESERWFAELVRPTLCQRGRSAHLRALREGL